MAIKKSGQAQAVREYVATMPEAERKRRSNAMKAMRAKAAIAKATGS